MRFFERYDNILEWNYDQVWSSFAETRRLAEEDYPLLTRVLMGPSEEAGKIFIMESDSKPELPFEVSTSCDKILKKSVIISNELLCVICVLIINC